MSPATGAALRIEPLTQASWGALVALFQEGGDPRWCWCQFQRLRSKDMAAMQVPALRERLYWIGAAVARHVAT